ncbi:conserved membrane hypothetical protein [Bradyrhizobium sp. STM 3843]|uniref:CvpA family protein n=1 Tax=Bradyrhizobium sp. STM 3843 TaxID=551947 RepID=UPI0002403703|nr:CvpA family protein [Bradyrhizobium sp. STM 3843]CCE10217.1 conserved membrane hypothetical protein [Bradyrhizobium sp. STM 3843]
MNSFDLVVYAALLIAVVSGFNTGLLRSAITILAYLLAMPLAVAATASLAPHLQPQPASPVLQNWTLFFVTFLVIGMICGKLGRMMLDEAVGAEAGIGDRLGGAALGALRVGMVATTVVLVFDQLVPAERQPGFLNGSQLRPLFSLAAQKGFRSLPPEAAAAVEKLKQERRI